MVAVLLGTLTPAAMAAVVESDAGACPSASSIEARLASLLPPNAPTVGRKARITRRGDRLRVELQDATGALLLERELPGTSPCAELAEAVAVVLAAGWTLTAPAVQLPSLDLAAPPTLRRPVPPPPRPWEVAGSAWVSFAGTAAAPGGTLEASVAPRGRRLGARIALLGAGPRDEALGPGWVSWTRLAASAGPRYALSKGRFLVSVYGEVLVALVVAQGRGYTESLTSVGGDLGLGGGARIGLRLGPIAPFVGGGVAGWLLPQALRVAGLESTSTLPRFEVMLLAGAGVGRFP
ncbi:MAG: hypothetical protein RMK29_06310 [Myxococcales bacterium]|nr:hypothetical protein [Myxococcota bacterium]MDW8281305.1 hypothetical protein [Myxococcales bacterium]